MVGELIKKIAQNPSPFNSKVCTVTAVNKESRTIDAQPIDDTAEVFDIKLQAFIDSNRGFVVLPKKDSYVIVTFMNEMTGFVSAYSEIDIVSFQNDEMNLRTELDNLFGFFSDTLSMLKEFQLMTNTGVTVQVMPQVQLKIESLKQTLQQIQTKFQTAIE